MMMNGYNKCNREIKPKVGQHQARKLAWFKLNLKVIQMVLPILASKIITVREVIEIIERKRRSRMTKRSLTITAQKI